MLELALGRAEATASVVEIVAELVAPGLATFLDKRGEAGGAWVSGSLAGDRGAGLRFGFTGAGFVRCRELTLAWGAIAGPAFVR